MRHPRSDKGGRATTPPPPRRATTLPLVHPDPVGARSIETDPATTIALGPVTLQRVAEGSGHVTSTGNPHHRVLVLEEGGQVEATLRRGRDRLALTLGPTHLALTPAGTAEAWVLRGPLNGIALWIDPEAGQRFLVERLHVLDHGPGLERMVAVEHAGLARLARRMATLSEAGGIGAQVMLEAMTTLFLATVIRDLAEPSNAAGPVPGLDYVRLVRFVHANLERRIPIAELAREAGMSEAALRRGLRMGMGLSPSGLVRRLRAARARDMIGAGAPDLGRVAMACGYADQAHLSRSFRRAYGETPGTWRAAVRGRADAAPSVRHALL